MTYCLVTRNVLNLSGDSSVVRLNNLNGKKTIYEDFIYFHERKKTQLFVFFDTLKK